MGLAQHEKENFGFLIGGGVLLAVLSIMFRFFVERGMFGIPATLFNFQYVIGVVMLGLLIVLLWQSNSQMANYAYAVMAFALSMGLLFPPATMSLEEVIMSAALLPLVIGGGVYHYRFNDASNTLFIGFLTVLAHEFYLFGAAYIILAVMELGQPLIIIGIIVLTAILHGARRILLDELEKTMDTTRLAMGVEVFLAPTRISKYRP